MMLGARWDCGMDHRFASTLLNDVLTAELAAGNYRASTYAKALCASWCLCG